MIILERVKSKTDNVTKYIFEMHDGLITEFSYLNKGDGKDIICVSTQTLCAQRCKFCHVTDHIGKLKLRDISYQEIINGVGLILDELDTTEDCLLVSFMGCGEPLDNVKNVALSMELLEELYFSCFKTVRFAIATMIPLTKWHNFFYLTNFVKEKSLQLKIHLSLHYTKDLLREQWMPNALPIRQSIDSLVWATEVCGVKGEIHYALIDGVNDNSNDILQLKNLIIGTDINIKFLFYNEKDTVDAIASSKTKYESYFSLLYPVEHEYYMAPGLDVGASCGQFLLEWYEKFNKIS